MSVIRRSDIAVFFRGIPCEKTIITDMTFLFVFFFFLLIFIPALFMCVYDEAISKDAIGQSVQKKMIGRYYPRSKGERELQ